MAGNPFWEMWYFHVPNYLLAALFWTLLGRFVLGIFVPADWENYIWRAFRQLTDWALRAFGAITPRMVPPPLMPLVAAFWVYALRVALLFAVFTPRAAAVA